MESNAISEMVEDLITDGIKIECHVADGDASSRRSVKVGFYQKQLMKMPYFTASAFSTRYRHHHMSVS